MAVSDPEDFDGDPVQARDALAAGEGFVDSLCPPVLLKCGADEGDEAITVQALVVKDVDGRLVLAVPACLAPKSLEAHFAERVFNKGRRGGGCCMFRGRPGLCRGGLRFESLVRPCGTGCGELVGSVGGACYGELWKPARRRGGFSFCAGPRCCGKRQLHVCLGRVWPAFVVRAPCCKTRPARALDFQHVRCPAFRGQTSHPCKGQGFAQGCAESQCHSRLPGPLRCSRREGCRSAPCHLSRVRVF